MSQFPAEIYTPRTLENLDGVVFDPAKLKVLFAEDQNGAADEIVAIEQTLGLNPQGSYASVAARLAAMGGSSGAGATSIIPATSRPDVSYMSGGKITNTNSLFNPDIFAISPIIIPVAGIFTRMSVRVATPAGSGTFRLGLYADDNGSPGELLLESEPLSALSAARVDFTFSEFLPAGIYWTAILSGASGPSVTLNANATTNGICGYNTAVNPIVPIFGFYRSLTYGNLPADESDQTYLKLLAGAMPSIALG